MRARRRLRWLGIAAAVIAVGAVWLGWWAIHQPATVTRAELALRVSSDRSIEVVPGTPIVFDVYLTTGKGIAPTSIGRRGHAWHTLVSLIDVKSRRKLSWDLVLLEAPETTAFTTSADGRPGMSETKEEVAVVDRDHVHHLMLSTSPETMSTVAVGTYEVQAVLESERWPPWGWHGRLESAPVTITIQKLDGDTIGQHLEDNRLAAAARFYMHSRRTDDAGHLAEQLVQRQPTNGAAWMLFGDTLDAGSKPGDALNAYRRALAVTPRRYEEPTLLYERIGAVMRKLRP